MGRTGNECLAAFVERMESEGIDGTMYSHPIGDHVSAQLSELKSFQSFQSESEDGKAMLVITRCSFASGVLTRCSRAGPRRRSADRSCRPEQSPRARAWRRWCPPGGDVVCCGAVREQLRGGMVRVLLLQWACAHVRLKLEEFSRLRTVPFLVQGPVGAVQAGGERHRDRDGQPLCAQPPRGLPPGRLEPNRRMAFQF